MDANCAVIVAVIAPSIFSEALPSTVTVFIEESIF